MPKLAQSAFLRTYPNRFCLNFHFVDQPGAVKSDGDIKPDKALPAPSALIAKFVKLLAIGDYAIVGVEAETIQQVLFCDAADIRFFVGKLRLSPQRGTGDYAITANYLIDRGLHAKMARDLDLA